MDSFNSCKEMIIETSFIHTAKCTMAYNIQKHDKNSKIAARRVEATMSATRIFLFKSSWRTTLISDTPVFSKDLD
ncbi:hypothetical protein L2E82_04668 [Cichorium intybus]|uniref:Uncharacterized protein n=1 Tax=Cichorium intybus TaxID=13427 RepID=A0ACB9H7Z3_CICIN|nr:hypothetical protein L2E82_04668 [Cichorium intybus]